MFEYIISACNHKTLGLYYLWFAFIFGLLGSLMSIILRIELFESGVRIITLENQNFYNLSFTLHGLIMIFFTVMPGLYGGFGNYFIPIFNGSPEVSFPRVNSISLLLLPVSFGVLILSLITEFGAGVGWTLYPPLSTSLMALSPVSVDFIIIGLAISGISSFLSSLNFVTTIFNIRIKGLYLSCLVFNSWAVLFTAFLLILTLPVLTSGLLMIVSDIHLNTQFYDPIFSGDPVLYQHLFWFFGHPEVYVLIIPGFAIISQIISVTTNKIIFGSQAMILAMGCIAILGCIVWAHHMMTVGLEGDTRAFFTAATILISIPTGTKIFNWLSTYMGNYYKVIESTTLFALTFVILFTLGGTTGVILGNAAVDITLHDTYYVIAHFHFVLSLGAILSIFAGVTLFQVTFLGKDKIRNSILLIWGVIFTISIVITFLPLHILGFNVMPRRIPDYSDTLSMVNVISSTGSTITILNSLLLY